MTAFTKRKTLAATLAALLLTSAPLALQTLPASAQTTSEETTTEDAQATDGATTETDAETPVKKLPAEGDATATESVETDTGGDTAATTETAPATTDQATEQVTEQPVATEATEIAAEPVKQAEQTEAEQAPAKDENASEATTETEQAPAAAKTEDTAPAASEENTEEAAKPADETEPKEGDSQTTATEEAKDAEPGVAPAEADAKAAEQAERAASQPADQSAPAAIVKDEMTAEQRAALDQAEKKRRDRKKKDRLKLLGAFAAGAAVGTVVNALGGEVVEDQGDRLVVRENDRLVIRKDENELLRRDGATISDEVLDNGNLRTVVTRPNGVRIISVRDPGGFLLRRVRVEANGDRYVLIDNTTPQTRREQRQRRRDFREELGPLRLDIDQDDYVVETRRSDRRAIRRALAAQPVEQANEVYTLREVRESERLRQKVRRVDLDTITFNSGSFSLTQSQINLLADVADAMNAIIDNNPREIFLIEGHTDAVGDELPNLTLSDRRAETVARILIDIFDTPPENLVVQGYGERYLKVNTQSDERANRRVTVRRITPLIATASR